MPAEPRRCSTCRRWSPAAGRSPDRGTCADPITATRPESAGVAGLGTITDDGNVVTRRDAVCPRWTPVPVRHR